MKKHSCAGFWSKTFHRIFCHSLVNIYADLELMASIMPTLTDVKQIMAIFLGENPPFGGLKQRFGMGHPAMAKD